MQKKQFFASLEIAEEEIRLLVAEYHMSRFNVLRSEFTETLLKFFPPQIQRC